MAVQGGLWDKGHEWGSLELPHKESRLTTQKPETTPTTRAQRQSTGVKTEAQAEINVDLKSNTRVLGFSRKTGCVHGCICIEKKNRERD